MKGQGGQRAVEAVIAKGERAGSGPDRGMPVGGPLPNHRDGRLYGDDREAGRLVRTGPGADVDDAGAAGERAVNERGNARVGPTLQGVAVPDAVVELAPVRHAIAGREAAAALRRRAV